MLLCRHEEFQTLANEAVSGEVEACDFSDEAERRRIKTPQDCDRLWSACAGEAESFGGEAARAGSEASASGRSAERSHVHLRMQPVTRSAERESDAFFGRRGAMRFPDRKQTNPGSRSNRKITEPNKAVELTPTLVTSCACAHLAPSVGVAHL